MITIPHIFLNDILKSYHTYLICKDYKQKFIECMNNYIINDKYEDCNKFYENILKYKCL
jgi:hypothetical protein